MKLCLRYAILVPQEPQNLASALAAVPQPVQKRPPPEPPEAALCPAGGAPMNYSNNSWLSSEWPIKWYTTRTSSAPWLRVVGVAEDLLVETGFQRKKVRRWTRSRWMNTDSRWRWRRDGERTWTRRGSMLTTWNNHNDRRRREERRSKKEGSESEDSIGS